MPYPCHALFRCAAANLALKGTTWPLVLCCWLGLLLTPAVFALPSTPHHTLEIQVDSPESDVVQAVQAVTEDPIVHGTYSYEKEKLLLGAHVAESAPIFGKWNGPGKVFYKVDENVISPRYFEDTGDIGTISIRYVVQAVSEKSTGLLIDAVFVDARHGVHWSEGAVESAEYGAVQQQIRQLQALRRQPRVANESSSRDESFSAVPQESSVKLGAGGAVSGEQELEQHVDSLRHQLERRVKAEGAQLKSAPFQSATTIEKLPANTEVLLLVVTPYWYGIETDDGRHGWIHHSQLEPLP